MTRFPNDKAYALELLQKEDENYDDEDRVRPIQIIELDVAHGEHGYDFCAGGSVKTANGDIAKFKLEESYWAGTYYEPPEYEVNIEYLHWFESGVKNVQIEGEAWRAALSIGLTVNLAQVIEKLFWLAPKQPYIICSKPGWRIVARYERQQVHISYVEVPNVNTQSNQSDVSEMPEGPVTAILGREASQRS